MEGKAMKKWEYKLVTPRANQTATRKAINDLTREGWRVVPILVSGDILMEREISKPHTSKPLRDADPHNTDRL